MALRVEARRAVLGCLTVRACTPPWFAKKGSDQIDVVHAMIQNLHPRKSLEKRPQMRRSVDGDAHLHVMDLTKQAAFNQIPCRHDVRSVAELEVDRRVQLPFATEIEDLARLGEGLPHGFLDEDRRAAGQIAQRGQ
jgi:hypothetical protein